MVVFCLIPKTAVSLFLLSHPSHQIDLKLPAERRDFLQIGLIHSILGCSKVVSHADHNCICDVIGYVTNYASFEVHFNFKTIILVRFTSSLTLYHSI